MDFCTGFSPMEISPMGFSYAALLYRLLKQCNVPIDFFLYLHISILKCTFLNRVPT